MAPPPSHGRVKFLPFEQVNVKQTLNYINGIHMIVLVPQEFGRFIK